jgi:hypothetical protein
MDGADFTVRWTEASVSTTGCMNECRNHGSMQCLNADWCSESWRWRRDHDPHCSQCTYCSQEHMDLARDLLIHRALSSAVGLRSNSTTAAADEPRKRRADLGPRRTSSRLSESHCVSPHLCTAAARSSLQLLSLSLSLRVRAPTSHKQAGPVARRCEAALFRAETPTRQQSRAASAIHHSHIQHPQPLVIRYTTKHCSWLLAPVQDPADGRK